METALAFLSQATDGTTFEELKNGLHLNVEKSSLADQYLNYYGLLQKGAGNATLFVANQLFVQEGYKLNKNFPEIAVKKFMSGIESVDFTKSNETAEIINRFVEEKTQNKIKNLLKSDSINKDSRVVLVNAIYLKAKWQYEFETYETYKQDFYATETEKASVDFMEIKESLNYGNFPELDASVLEMKYIDSDFSLLTLLPNSHTGLSALEAKLKNCDFHKITDQMRVQLVNVTIPKFRVESEIKLNDILKAVSGILFEVF